MKLFTPWFGLVLMLMGSAAVQAATYTVGNCSGSTHVNLKSAWDEVGGGNGHVINLCAGSHTSPALIPTARHNNITLKSLSGNAADTTLIASSGTLFGLTYHNYTISNLTVKANFSSESPAVFNNSIITGTITTTGTLTIVGSSVTGNISGRNGVTITKNQVIAGNITATNGPISITGGTVNGIIGTNGGSQPITLTNISMTGGSITTAGNTITIKNSVLGSVNSRIPIHTNNNVVAEGTTIWGDIKAGNWNSISLNSTTKVHGYCDPALDDYGGGICQPGDGPGGGDDGGSGGSCDVQLQLGINNHIAGASITISLHANILEGEDGCFDGEQEIAFYSQRINPDTPAPGDPRGLRLNNTLIAADSPDTTLPVMFSNNDATLSLIYPDAGHMQLHACWENTCSYAGFVARPAEFVLEVPDNPGTVNASGSVFTAAGAEFRMLVTAIGANGESLPNFGRESSPAGVLLNTTLRAPVGGVNPGLSGGFGPFGLNCDNNTAAWGTACGTFTWSEVGAIAITPRIAGGNYLNTGPNIIGPTVDVGRFIPHHFTLYNPAIKHRSALTCSPASNFTYLGEDLIASFELQAQALGGVMTRNYAGSFARLPTDDLNPAALHNNENLTDQLSQRAAAISWSLGTGEIELTLQMARTTGAPNATPAGPWTALQLGVQPVDADGVRLADSQLTLDLNNDSINDHGLLEQVDLRFGRLLLDNALGSELGTLQLPATAQYWNGITWVNNADDSCTRLSLASQVQLNDTLSGTATVPVGSGNSQITSGGLQLNDGRGFIVFSAPGSAGYIDVELLLGAGVPDYLFLQDDRDADGSYTENPRGRASWGLFPGNDSMIWTLEAQP